MHAELIAEVPRGERFALTARGWLEGTLREVLPRLREAMVARPVVNAAPLSADFGTPWGEPGHVLAWVSTMRVPVQESQRATRRHDRESRAGEHRACRRSEDGPTRQDGVAGLGGAASIAGIVYDDDRGEGSSPMTRWEIRRSWVRRSAPHVACGRGVADEAGARRRVGRAVAVTIGRCQRTVMSKVTMLTSGHLVLSGLAAFAAAWQVGWWYVQVIVVDPVPRASSVWK
jgi:hypothetical protein